MTLRREKIIFNSLLLDRVLFWRFFLMACETETTTSLVVIHTLKRTLESKQKLPCLSSKSFRVEKENDKPMRDMGGCLRQGLFFYKLDFAAKKYPYSRRRHIFKAFHQFHPVLVCKVLMTFKLETAVN